MFRDIIQNWYTTESIYAYIMMERISWLQYETSSWFFAMDFTYFLTACGMVSNMSIHFLCIYFRHRKKLLWTGQSAFMQNIMSLIYVDIFSISTSFCIYRSEVDEPFFI